MMMMMKTSVTFYFSFVWGDYYYSVSSWGLISSNSSSSREDGCLRKKPER